MFRDALPWEEGVGATHGDASGQVHCICYGFLEESRIGGGDGDLGPIYERQSGAGAGRNAWYELFSWAMCCWVASASWS